MSALYAIAAVLAASGFLLAAGGLFYRAHRAQQADITLERRISGTQAKPEDADAVLPDSWFSRRLLDLVAIGKRFSGSRLEKALLTPEDFLLLDQTGWNNKAGTAAYLGGRVLLALLMPLVALLLLRPAGIQVVVVTLTAAAFGVLAPKFALNIWAGRLRKKVGEELPLMIDLLRLLQGVGFSTDQSLQMLGDKLQVAIPVIGKELASANLSYSRGRGRAQSLRRLSAAFGNDDLQSLIQLILQVHQHGGAVQDPLRQFSARLREQRRMTMKEKVGKLSVKMTVVMMLTLLPALMLVLAGPAILALADALTKMS